VIKVGLAEEARDDLSEGFRFYEDQERGSGGYFISCLRDDIQNLTVTGGIHRVDYADYHRVLSRVFPYAIYYTFEDETVTIWAVIDCRRSPEWIRKRLGS